MSQVALASLVPLVDWPTLRGITGGGGGGGGQNRA